MYIEFEGELTGECKKFLLKKQKKIQFIVTTTMSVLISIVVIALAIHFQNPLMLLAFILIIVLELIGTNSISKGDKALFMPISVYIDTEEETIVQKSEKRETFCMLDDIATVEDHGEWYNFTFEYGHGSPYFVCQKDLLTQGTIEEFETLFEEKIVRMY